MTRRMAFTLVAVFALTVAGVPALAHPGHEHKMMGTVTMVGPDHVMLKDKDGKDATVYVNKSTKIVKDKKPAKLEDVQNGMRIVVTAETEKDKMIAKQIELGVAATTK